MVDSSRAFCPCGHNIAFIDWPRNKPCGKRWMDRSDLFDIYFPIRLLCSCISPEFLYLQAKYKASRFCCIHFPSFHCNTMLVDLAFDLWIN